jgi:1,4-dihydroxy-2-naphthoyl-CoA hydrolase
MYRYQTRVHLHDTDATGVIYFSQQLNLAMQAFENFLRQGPFSLKDILASPYLLPIVHAEADYLSPLTVDNELDIVLYLHKMGTSSFTISYDFFYRTSSILAGTAKITHVLTLKETKKSTPIPEELRGILKMLLAIEEGSLCE